MSFERQEPRQRKHMKSVYLAGPITGTSYDECVDWRKYIRRALPAQIKAYSPMRAKDYLEEETDVKHIYEEKVMSSQRGLFARDANDCRMCDGLIVNFIGAEKVSIGSVMEIAWFWWQRKPIVLIMAHGTVHDHPMIREACPFTVQTLDEAIHVMTAVLLPVGH